MSERRGQGRQATASSPAMPVPVLCRIRPGRTGACDRYGNVEGVLTRMDPMVIASRTEAKQGAMVPFLGAGEWKGTLLPARRGLRHRHRRRHHLSRLQAGALHRLQPAWRCRHGHRRDRGHLQLLRPEAEDRHRPLRRPGAGGRARARASRWAM